MFVAAESNNNKPSTPQSTNRTMYTTYPPTYTNTTYPPTYTNTTFLAKTPPTMHPLKIRTSGMQTSNIDIMKFSKLFEDEITLDNLSLSQLRAMCQLLEVTPVLSSSIMRFQLEMKLRDLKADDKVASMVGIGLVE